MPKLVTDKRAETDESEPLAHEVVFLNALPLRANDH